MGHIKEPEGVDFIIQSKPLTDEEKAANSEYIRNYKAKQKAKRSAVAVPSQRHKVKRHLHKHTGQLMCGVW